MYILNREEASSPSDWNSMHNVGNNIYPIGLLRGFMVMGGDGPSLGPEYHWVELSKNC